MKLKEPYNGLTTTRQNVASSPIMATSTKTIKVKTDLSTGTEGWQEDLKSTESALTTSITSDTQF